MPSYTCEKCAKVFAQKSGYDSHLKRKKPCVESTVLTEVIATAVREAVKEVTSVAPVSFSNASAYACSSNGGGGSTSSADKPKETVFSSEKATNEHELQKFFQQLHNMLWSNAGLNPQAALEHLTFFFAYRLIELQADPLGLPQECRWSYLANLPDENTMYEVMKKGVTAFQKNKVTQVFFKKPEIKKAETVMEIVKHINTIDIKVLQETDTLGNIFEYMLSRGMSTMADEGQYFTNRKICALAFKLAHSIHPSLRRPDGSLCTFADWFCGTGGFAAEYVKGVKGNIPDIDWSKEANAIMCQDMNQSSVTTTLLNLLILTGTPFSSDTIRSGNSFADPITLGAGAPFKNKTIDFCFMNPPYGGDKTKGKEFKFAYCKEVKDDTGAKVKKYFVNQEIQSIGIEDDDKVSAGVQLGMATMSTDGVAAIVLPQGFFFGASKKAVELRKKISEEYKIHYVVDIASGSFLNTGTKTSMIVFEKGKTTDTIKFMDMEQKVLAEATLEDLRSKNYSLNFKQYLAQTAVEVEGFEMVKLGDIVKPQSLKHHSTTEGNKNGKYPLISSALNIEYYIDTFDSEVPSLIFNTINADGNCSIHYFEKFNVTSNTYVLSGTNKITLQYIYYYLKTKPEILKDCFEGTTKKALSRPLLLNIEIPLPSLERQQEIVEAIDGWANLAQQEEIALKLLEKQVMFQVKEMGRGQPRVKLGDVCEINHGKRITKKENLGTIYPVYGGGDDTFRTDNKNREGFTCKVSRFGISEHNCVQMIYGDYWLMDSGFTVKGLEGKSYDPYIYYWLNQNRELVYQCGRATAQMNMDMDTFRNLEIPLPPLTQQQILQPDFDEIRHKHEKIAYYKAKAQEAIAAHIPSNA